MDEVDEMVVAVRADTDGFRRDIAAMRDELAGPLVSAADAAGRGIERALSRAVLSGKLGFEDLKRSEEHTSELQSLIRISYAVFCLKKKMHLNISDTTCCQRIYIYYKWHHIM